VLICDTESINDGDELEVDMELGKVKNLTSGAELSFSRIPEIMLRILNEGGLIPYIKKHKDFVVG
jgi:3-isopropylmalate/(R)-2-methylmalate dehydratase small subunit